MEERGNNFRHLIGCFCCYFLARAIVVRAIVIRAIFVTLRLLYPIQASKYSGFLKGKRHLYANRKSNVSGGQVTALRSMWIPIAPDSFIFSNF